MPRPYLSLPIEELEALFEQRWQDLGTLRLLSEELENRHTERGRSLLTRVHAELRKRGQEPEPQGDLLSASSCAFCTLPAARVVQSSDRCIAFGDAYPVSVGHTLIAPKRHVASFFDTTLEERLELFKLIDVCRHQLVARHHPAGFNIGINDGKAAGQTVMHLHIHFIPRYAGDSPDPRGGIRWILPEKADYWSRR